MLHKFYEKDEMNAVWIFKNEQKFQVTFYSVIQCIHITCYILDIAWTKTLIVKFFQIAFELNNIYAFLLVFNDLDWC